MFNGDGGAIICIQSDFTISIRIFFRLTQQRCSVEKINIFWKFKISFVISCFIYLLLSFVSILISFGSRALTQVEVVKFWNPGQT